MNNIVKKYPVLGSSVNPEELSLTIKSAIPWLVPFLSFVLIKSGVDVAEGELVTFINAVATFAAAGMTVYGLGRKLWVKISALWG